MKLIENKKIGLTYEIEERLEAGIELLGSEVKSVRNKNGSLDGGKVIIRGGEVYLIGSYIPPYQPKNSHSVHEPERIRKLLLKKADIIRLSSLKNSPLTIVPISLYNKGIRLKCEIGICRKKNTRDKREILKKKISKREILGGM